MDKLTILMFSCLILYANAQCRCSDYQVESQCIGGENDMNKCVWINGGCRQLECSDLKTKETCFPLLQRLKNLSIKDTTVDKIFDSIEMERCNWDGSACKSISSCGGYTDPTSLGCLMSFCMFNESSKKCVDFTCDTFKQLGNCSQGKILSGGKMYGCKESGDSCSKTDISTSCSSITEETECKFSLMACKWKDDKCESSKCSDAENETDCQSQQQMNSVCEWKDKCNAVTIMPLSEVDCGDFQTEAYCSSGQSPCQWSSSKCVAKEDCSTAGCKDVKTTQPYPVLKDGFDFVFCKGDGSKCADATPSKTECVGYDKMFFTWKGDKCESCIYLSDSIHLIASISLMLVMAIFA